LPPAGQQDLFGHDSVTRHRRLAILERKASENLDLSLQAAD
jgi:hypothetical protein